MSYQSFKSKWLGKRIDYDGAEWRKIENPKIKSGYFVSDTGRVISTRRGYIQEMTVCKHRDGYGQVCFMKSNEQNKTLSLKVHRLVAEAFIPNTDGKAQVNHIDENKLNNNKSNLEWATAYENNHHSKSEYYKKLSKDLQGVGIGQKAKLHPEDIRDIRLFRKNGVRLKDIAKVYGLSLSSISLIANNKEWSWV